MMQAIVIWAAAGVVAAIAAAFIAEYKGRLVTYWAAWSFLVAPMVLVLLLLVPKNTGERTRPAKLDDEAEA
jgi:hypothetical protein